jgi:hypothetical protein
MAEGTDTYKGLAVPLFGDFEIRGRTAATDIMTITAASGASGDFIVCQTVGGGELFVVDNTGALTAAAGLTVSAGGATVAVGDLTVTAGDVIITSGTNYLRFSSGITSAPGTALTKGDVFLGFGNTTRPQIGICISTAANTLWYITADTSVFGSTTRNSA